MFWRFGGYATISTLDTILDKPDVTLQELLDESDLIQELKQCNTKLIEYLRDENVLRRLLEYVIAPATPKPELGDEERTALPSNVRTLSPFKRSKEYKAMSRRQEELEEWEQADKTRQKYAYVACEILSSETWSILEALMENQQHLRVFWDFLRRQAPLDALDAGYFTKINETLLDKKPIEMLQFVKSLDGIIPAMIQHVDCPMVMDLLLKMISMEKVEGAAGVVDWLQSQDLIPLLLAYLDSKYPPATQTSAGDFIKAIITISANASQNEQSCIGPNNLTRQLVSDKCIETLVQDMLRGGNPLTVIVGTVIEVIRKNNSDYDPDVGAGPDSVPSGNDPIYLGNLLRTFATHVPDFMSLILSPNHTVLEGDKNITVQRKDLPVAFGRRIEPLGFDRFKTCELMAELLHCSNMGLLNERGSEAFVRQRDEERDRLKAEGFWNAARPPTSAATEFSEDSTGYANGVSPLGLGPSASEEARRLEVANNADDDGFEDVGSSADLADDIKDDFDEKSSGEGDLKPEKIPSLPRPMKPRLDLDEDFVDEPLTSPRIEALDDKEEELLEDFGAPESLEVEPFSPTFRLSSQVQDLTLGKDRSAGNDVLPISPAERESDPDHSGAASRDGTREAPSLPPRRRSLEPGPHQPSLNSVQTLNRHPEDQPPPLFASRLDHSSQLGFPPPPHDQDRSGGNSQDTIDSTLGEEGDSIHSVSMSGNDESFTPEVENDIDGQPVVGDFLKMMFVEHRVVPTILDFFFRFPWNNFLHNVVYDIVQQVFNGPMDRGYNRSLAIDLFQTGRITERIVEGQQRSDEAQAQKNMRLGYMGHLTLIAEEVVKFTERHPPEVLSQAVLDKVTSRQWNDYVENTLADTRERDNAILGGIRPDVAVGPRQDGFKGVGAGGNPQGFVNTAASVLASAGLNGNAGLDSVDVANSNGSHAMLSGNAFKLSSGSLFSGFGSSSDEEDEEMEEFDEHDGGGGNSMADPDQHPPLATATNTIPFFPKSIFPIVSTTPSSSSSSSTTPTTAAGAVSAAIAAATTTAAATATGSLPQAPLFAPPPPLPPPLNLPPSRARRQLAARLARHHSETGRGAMTSLGIGEESSAGIEGDDSRAAAAAAAAAAHGGDETLENRDGEGEDGEDEEQEVKNDLRTKEPPRRDSGSFIERGFEASRDGDRDMERRGGRATEMKGGLAGSAGSAGAEEEDDDDDDDDSDDDDDDDDEAVEMRVLLR